MAVQIQVQDETWGRLQSKKLRPSQTFDEIITTLLNVYDKISAEAQ